MKRQREKKRVKKSEKRRQKRGKKMKEDGNSNSVHEPVEEKVKGLHLHVIAGSELDLAKQNSAQQLLQPKQHT